MSFLEKFKVAALLMAALLLLLMLSLCACDIPWDEIEALLYAEDAGNIEESEEADESDEVIYIFVPRTSQSARSAKSETSEVESSRVVSSETSESSQSEGLDDFVSFEIDIEEETYIQEEIVEPEPVASYEYKNDDDPKGPYDNVELTVGQSYSISISGVHSLWVCWAFPSDGINITYPQTDMNFTFIAETSGEYEINLIYLSSYSGRKEVTFVITVTE